METGPTGTSPANHRRAENDKGQSYSDRGRGEKRVFPTDSAIICAMNQTPNLTMSSLAAHFACVMLGTVALLAGVATGGCSSTGIAMREMMGYAKREQLVDRVKEARDGQQEAKKQFESALAEFIAVTGATDAELEGRYKLLKGSYDTSESKASTVRDRIKSVERVSEALFSEWKEELKQYNSEALRAASQKQLDDTRTQYDKLIGVMKAAAGKMDPVLAAFKDQVLFMKHNLNARAIASLEKTNTQLQSDINALIKDMEKSIAEANSFVEQMQTGK